MRIDFAFSLSSDAFCHSTSLFLCVFVCVGVLCAEVYDVLGNRNIITGIMVSTSASR